MKMQQKQQKSHIIAWGRKRLNLLKVKDTDFFILWEH